MQEKGRSRSIKRLWIALFGAALGAASWFTDAAVHAFVLYQGTFGDYLTPNDALELWKRSLVGLTFILFGGSVQLLVNRLQETRLRLNDSESRLQNEVFLKTEEMSIANRELRQVNRILESMNAFNRIRASFREESELLFNTCRIIVETGGYRFAWIGYAGQDEDKTVFPIAHAGHENGYLQSVKISWADNEFGKGPTGTAIRSGQPAVLKDIGAAGSYSTWQKEALERGYSSSISLPLILNKQIIGVVNMYSSEPDAFEPQEVNLLTQLVKEVEYSISSLRTRLERNFAEEALKQSEEMLRIKDAAIASSISGFVLTDLHGRLTYVNETFLRYWGYDDQRQVLGRHVRDFWHETEKFSEVIDVIRQRGNWSGDLVARKSDGSTVDIQLSANVVKDVRGQDLCMFGSFIDITEKKRLAAQLLQSQKMESVGQLAGGIAHDFNNILMAIKGDAYIMGMKMGKENPFISYVESITKLSEKAAFMTRDLLAFSRKNIVSSSSVNVNRIIESTLMIVGRLLPEDINVSIDYSSDDLTILADSGQLEQVMVNLINNARDAMPQGGELKIRTGIQELDEGFIRDHGYGKTGPYAVVTVSDNGIGMAETTRERIYEPFFTTKEVGRGTGLGLSVVYGIIKQHGGYIVCDSSPGDGTVFRIFFPIARSEKEPEKNKNMQAATGGQETVLLAEDNLDVRNTLSVILKENGYGIIEAVDGEEAVCKFTEHKDSIDIVLMDVIMPKMNGKEVCDRIRLLHPEVKVLFMSGYDYDIINKKGILDDQIDLISKPIKPVKLLEKIREVLDRHSIQSSR